MKNLLFTLVLFTAIAGKAQTLEQKILRGSIKVPADTQAEGISIYNKNLGKGTIADENGKFRLAARAGDSLYFSAIQFQDLLVVVDKQVMKAGRIDVKIVEGINELPEVIVRPHKLSGNPNSDVQCIEVVPIEIPLSRGVLNVYDWEFRPDNHAAVENSTMNEGGMIWGANIINIFKALTKSILPSREPTKPLLGPVELRQKIRTLYNDKFFTETLKIPTKKIPYFLDFVIMSGFNQELLQEQRALDLIELLINRSKSFRKSSE